MTRSLTYILVLRLSRSVVPGGTTVPKNDLAMAPTVKPITPALPYPPRQSDPLKPDRGRWDEPVIRPSILVGEIMRARGP